MTTRILLLAACFSLIPALGQAATNLLVNPKFDAGVAGWTPDVWLKATVAASPVDESGKAEGGSLRVHQMQPGPWDGNILSNCFALEPGQDVVFGASGWAAELGDGHTVNAHLSFHTDGGCATASIDHVWAELNQQMGAATWRPVQGNTVAPPGTQSARLWLFVAVDSAAPGEILIDNAFVYAGATCATTTQVLCLNDGRFRVYAQWALADGERGWGNVRAFTGDSGYSTFFDPANIELVVKVLDGCSYNGRFWVFAAGLTNVTVDLWVYDTEQDEYWTHHSPVDTAFQPVQDTTAFATCPH